MSKRLVIDASVLQASGESVHPVSRACREFLEHVRDICHRAVVTTAILNEWNRHQSKFAYQWRKSMYARRKVVVILVAPDLSLRQRLQRRGLTAAERDTLLKDVHLIEAALAADRIVASRDDQARSLFSVAELNEIVWVNPATHHEDCLRWLAGGAKPVKRWLLGSG